MQISNCYHYSFFIIHYSNMKRNWWLIPLKCAVDFIRSRQNDNYEALTAQKEMRPRELKMTLMKASQATMFGSTLRFELTFHVI